MKTHYFNESLEISESMSTQGDQKSKEYYDKKEVDKIIKAIYDIEMFKFEKTGKVSTVMMLCEGAKNE